MAIRNAHFDITAADKTQQAFSSVKRGLGDIGGSVNSLKGVFTAFAAVAGSLGLTQIINQAVQAASAAEQSSNRLDAVLKATGNAAGKTRDQLDEMANALARSTTFDDESIRDAQSQLIKFGNIHTETFDRALELSADYAAFTGGQMSEAAHQLGRALAAPKEGLNLLERQIGRFTDEQRKSIETMLEQGRVAEAQAIILKKVEDAIGGTAGNLNQGIYGATTAATKAYDDLLEALGRTGPVKLLVEGNLLSLARTMSIITKAIEDSNKAIDEQIRMATGQLKPLPNSVRGGEDTPLQSMTVEDVRIAGIADAKQRDEEALQREARAAEARKKYHAEQLKSAKERIAWMKLEADSRERSDQDIIDAIAVGQETQARRRQVELDWQAMIDESARQQGEAMLQTIALREQEAAEVWRLNASKTLSVVEGLNTERETLRLHFDEQMSILQTGYDQQIISEDLFRQSRLRLIERYEKDQARIEETGYRGRLRNNIQFRKLDLDAGHFFAGQMANLMQTNSRKMFEIGKAGAIAETAINTYDAAVGAYKAMAGIPIVGPALGAAAAAAAVAFGLAQVNAIRSQTFGGGGAAGTGVFAANPNTGLPVSNFSEPPPSPIQQQPAPLVRDITISFTGSGRYTQDEIRDALVPALQEAFDAGVKVRFQQA